MCVPGTYAALEPKGPTGRTISEFNLSTRGLSKPDPLIARSRAHIKQIEHVSPPEECEEDDSEDGVDAHCHGIGQPRTSLSGRKFHKCPPDDEQVKADAKGIIVLDPGAHHHIGSSSELKRPNERSIKADFKGGQANSQSIPAENTLEAGENGLCSMPSEVLSAVLDHCLNDELPSRETSIETNVALSLTNKRLSLHVLDWMRRRELRIRVKPLLEAGLPLRLPRFLLRQAEHLCMDFGGLTYSELVGRDFIGGLRGLRVLEDIWGRGSNLKRIRYFAPLDYRRLTISEPTLSRMTAMASVVKYMRLVTRKLRFQGKVLWEPDYTGVVNMSGQTAVLAAVSEGNEPLVRYIVEQSVDGVDTACGGLTPLYTAVLNEDVQLTRLLLETNRVDVNAVSRHRLETPLSMAVKMASHEIVRLLLRTGKADVTTPRGLEVRRPVETAQMYFEDDIVDILRLHISQMKI